MNLGTLKITFKSHYFAAFFLIALVSSALYLTGDNGGVVEKQESRNQQQSLLSKETYVEEELARNHTILRCNLFSGKWIFDNTSYPLYNERRCSFLLDDRQYACQENGRKDTKYQNWRWQPHDCDLPRFNGTVLLEKIRGKRLAFVGDSLNRNQWMSLLCLIEPYLQSSDKSVIRNGNLFIFQAIEYNATIEFYWSPFLVESNCDDPFNHQERDRIIRITAIEKHARHWTDADILIFDSFMWWLEPTMKVMWGTYGSSEAIYKKVEMRTRLYEMGLNIWSDWLEININRTKTTLFFMSLSPYHFHGESWDDQEHCYNETEPILKEDYWGVATDREMMRIAESVIQKLETRGLKIEYLNTTHLSDFRKDGHLSIYRKSFVPESEKQLEDPKSYSDCVHWCLPGVPDFWNQILCSYIVNF